MRHYSIDELKETRIIMDKKSPRFGVIITIITSFFLILIIILAAVSTKTYVVKTSSILSTLEKSNIMPVVTGKIKLMNFKNGESVSKGDIILNIEANDLEIQIIQLEKMINLNSSKIDILNRGIEYIDSYLLDNESTHTIPFDKNNQLEVSEYNSAKSFHDYVLQMKADETDEEIVDQDSIDSMKGQFTNQKYQQIDQIITQNLEVESQLELYKSNINSYSIKAEQDGVINYNANISVGTVLQAGSLIGTVSNNDVDNFYFDTYIPAEERSKIKINDKVEISITGISQSEFGVLNGIVTTISNDAIQTEDGNVLYRVVIKPNTSTLTNNKGEKINLSLGMVAESRVKYEEISWLKWAIEQIGVKFR